MRFSAVILMNFRIGSNCPKTRKARWGVGSSLDPVRPDPFIQQLKFVPVSMPAGRYQVPVRIPG